MTMKSLVPSNSSFTDVVSFYVSTNSSGSNITFGDSFGTSIKNIFDWDWPRYYYSYDYHQLNPSFPPMDIVQDKTNKFIEIKMAMAGFKKEDIDMEARDNYLIVSASLTKNDSYKKDDVVYVKNNLKAESFSRKFEFPDNAFDFRNPKVTYKDGMLIIWIERNPELSAKDKKITIE